MPSEIGHFAREPPINTLQPAQLGIILNSELCRLFRARNKRHTYASMLINSGESLYTVQQILGHSDPKLTQRYAHLSSSVLQDAANSVSKYLDKAKDKQGTGNN